MKIKQTMVTADANGIQLRVYVDTRADALKLKEFIKANSHEIN